MSRLNVRLDHLLREARALRQAHAHANDPARDEALTEKLMQQIGRMHDLLTPEQIAERRAMLPDTVEEIVAALRADLHRKMDACCG